MPSALALAGRHAAGSPYRFKHGWIPLTPGEESTLPDGFHAKLRKAPTATLEDADKARTENMHATGGKFTPGHKAIRNELVRRNGAQAPSEDLSSPAHMSDADLKSSIAHAEETLSSPAMRRRPKEQQDLMRQGIERKRAELARRASGSRVAASHERPDGGELALSEKTPTLSSTPRLLGKPNGPGLFHHKGWKLPDYIEQVAGSIHDSSGKPLSDCIQLAIGAIQRWARGQGKVSPTVRAASVKALAEWEALRAASHAASAAKDAKGGNKPTKAAQPRTDGLALASAFNPTQHPRASAGGATGGQFVPLGQANSASSAAAQADPASQRGYRTAMTMKTADRNKYIKGLSDGDLEKLSRIAYSSTTSDANIVALRVAVAKELAHRGVDVRGFGAHGTDLKIAKPKKPGAKAPKPPKPGSKPKAPAPQPGSTHLAQETTVNRLSLAGSPGAAVFTPMSDSQSGSKVTVSDTSKAAKQTGSGPTSTKLDAKGRRKAAKSGAALKDGSFPIYNATDVGNAVAAFGRANDTKKPMVKAHIKNRAAAVGAQHKLPAGWKK